MEAEKKQLNPRLFNIDILILDANNSRYLREISKLNIFEQSSANFEVDGLFSTEIFGPIGSALRNQKFGYINLNINVLHPLVYEHLIALRSLYKDIISGSKYAYFDKQLKDFVLCEQKDGETGYAFFMKYLNHINFIDNGSDQRMFRIKMIKKYSTPEYFINKWLVLPAGLRDYTVDAGGIPSEDEVNDLYRKLLTTTTMLKNTNVNEENIKLLDTTRLRIQNILVDIYEYYKTLMDGKNKFIQGKWAKRSVTYGTRNVITPLINNVTDLDDPMNIKMNHTVCGLYQFSKAISPVTMNKINTLFISRLMNPDTTSVLLVNKDNLQSELVNIKSNKRDEWLTTEGLDSMLNKLGQEDMRASAISVDTHYLMLVHDDGKNVELFFDTREIPDSYDKKFLRPITYAELVYIAIYDVKDKYPGFLTRYPVAGLGGIYPTNIYLKTTVVGRKVNIKIPGQDEKEMLEYPILSEEFVTSLSPNSVHISRLVADFDGDMVSLNIVYTEESIKEIKDMFKQKTFYLTPNGEITYSAKTEPLEYVLGHMTKFD